MLITKVVDTGDLTAGETTSAAYLVPARFIGKRAMFQIKGTAGGGTYDAWKLEYSFNGADWVEVASDVTTPAADEIYGYTEGGVPLPKQLRFKVTIGGVPTSATFQVWMLVGEDNLS